VLHGRVVSALVNRVQTIPRRNQDSEHPSILSSPDPYADRTELIG